MPDENKLKVINARGVTIARVCGNCLFADFDTPRSSWGLCTKSTYEHAKYGRRLQPANVIFTCPEWKPHPEQERIRELGKYTNLICKDAVFTALKNERCSYYDFIFAYWRRMLAYIQNPSGIKKIRKINTRVIRGNKSSKQGNKKGTE